VTLFINSINTSASFPDMFFGDLCPLQERRNGMLILIVMIEMFFPEIRNCRFMGAHLFIQQTQFPQPFIDEEFFLIDLVP